MSAPTASGREAARSRRAALVALAPVALGTAISLAWVIAADPNPPDVSVIADLEWLPALAGLALSLVIAALLWVRAGARREVRADFESRLAEQAERQRRMLSRLDHELKNPIQGIRTALADEPSDRQRSSIEVQSRRLTHLMSDLRKVAEVEHTELEVAPVDLTVLVAEAIDAVRELPATAQREVVLSLPQAPRPLPVIDGDGDLLFLALTNLLTNAVKYSDPGDRVEVRGRESAGDIVLEVADTGRGIPAHEIELVWEELGRGQEARGIEGSGLGLPLVRAIIRRHGGSCALESWHGQGSVVTVRLPVGMTAAR